AYFLIPESQKQATHLKIGRLLLSNTTEEEREEKIFDIVNQLNIGVELITNPTEREELAQLNLIAGRKAKGSTAYAAALRYLTVGMDFLAASSWQQQYELILALHEEAAESAFLSGDFEQMERLADIVLERASTLLDKVKVYEVKLKAYQSQNKLLEAVKMALEILKLLGVKFPQKPNQFDFWLSLKRTKLALAGKNPSDLIELPPMTNPINCSAMRIMSSIAAPAYITAPQLMPLIVFQQVNLSLKHGNVPLSAFAYAWYATILCGIVGDIENGYSFGQLAISLVERFNAKEIKAGTFHVVNTLTRHWKEHAKETLNPLLEAYSAGLETGDIEYAAYAIHVKCKHSYLIGKELGEVEKDMATYGNAISQIKQETVLNYHQIFQQTVLNLRGHTENPYYLIGEIYNEQTRLPLHQQANDTTAIGYVHFSKMKLCYLFGQYDQALENADITEKYIDKLPGLLFTPFGYFYDSLVRLAVYSSAPKYERERIFLKVKANQKKLKKWAVHAPMNFLHKFYLVEAERHRVMGQNVEAMNYYEKAISGAKEQEYLNEEALGNELAAKFYLAWGKQTIAQTYLTNAYYCYARWGAKAKVEDLEQRYSQLLAPILTQQTKTTSGETLTQGIAGTIAVTPTGNLSGLLDFATIIKGSQALSGEIQLDKLLSTLMQVVIENAGAEKGALILDKAGKLVIEATGISDTKETRVLQSIPIEQSQEIPVTLINYVYRTSQTLVLDDASTENTFSADPYIITAQPKSVLCTPIVNQGKLIGILYLENNLTTKAFTPDRLKVLNILSGQAAISITNAQLYAEVKENQSQLTQFLSAMPVGVSVHEPTGQIYYANQTAQQLLGINVLPEAKTEQLSQAYRVYRAGTQELYPTEQLPIVRSLSGERVKVDDIELHQPDKIISLEVSTTPILDETGKIVYAIAAFQDITQRKKAEKLIAEYNHTLAEQVKERTAQLAAANQEIMALNQRLKAENLRLSAELDVTRKLQQMILPKPEELAAIEGLEIAGFMEPADEVGGDYYDVIHQNGQVKISIGDVTGHGLESGVVMLMTQAAVRTLQESNQTDPVQFLDILNRTIYSNVQRINPNKNLTLALLDYADGALNISGQHEEIIVVRAGGQVEIFDTMNLGFPIGLDEEIADFIASEQVQLNSGDVVVLYTDGITEACDINHQQYGLERLCEIVRLNCSRSPQEIRQAVIEDLRQHIGAQKVFDDITLVVLKQK
ncbi:MAG TPA: hypothetical protein DDZ80_28805, partial [Cyanobacteria bacterium UBA8803]|nr:hypothetical protein [Cyanobacteria bacterium UBA8803]